MRTKLVALALVLLIGLTVVVYYSINSLPNSREPLTPRSPTPIPSQTPIPTAPPEPTVSVNGWGDPHVSYPTKLTITSPQNVTYQTSDLTLKVNVTTSFWVISSVYYKTDWLGDYHRIYSVNISPVIGEHSQALTLTANFTGIPDGSHTIEVIANYHDGSHASGTISFNTNSSTVP